MQVSKDNIPSKNTLLKEWQKTFGRPAPTGCHTSFLDKAIAWQQQALKHGGLTAAERRLLMGKTTSVPDNIHVGSHLVRVWQGETHQVTVLAKGYHYKDQHWKSLSAIARAITGTPWSGPLFFGLKK
ncbi:MAG: hypothetical protein ACI8PW_001648 [Methylophilaceae bacterium]|jgi:hypothetical protein